MSPITVEKCFAKASVTKSTTPIVATDTDFDEDDNLPLSRLITSLSDQIEQPMDANDFINIDKDKEVNEDMAHGWEQRLVDDFKFSVERSELPADNDAEEEQTVKSAIKNKARALEVITDLALYIYEQGLTEAVGKISEVEAIFQTLIIKSKCCSKAN